MTGRETGRRAKPVLSNDPASLTGSAGVKAIISVLAAPHGTGRTSMVSNLARILASVGKKVLVLDWGTENPTVHSYLHPFVADDSPLITELLDESLVTALTTAVEPKPGTEDGSRDWRPLVPCLQRYALRWLPGEIDVISCGEFDEARPITLAQLPDADIAALRQSLRATEYDYVLMDSPTEVSSAATAMIAKLCDVAVVLFTSSPKAVVEAERRTRSLLLDAPDGIKIVAAASLFDSGSSPKAQQGRQLISGVFARLLSNDPVTLIDIPHLPLYAASEALAVLVDEPGDPSTLAAAYEKVAAAVTSGVVTTQGPVPRKVRSRYRSAVRLPNPEPPDVLWLAYAPRDRPWADWIAAQLRSAGGRVNRLALERSPAQDPLEPGATVLVVVSEHFVTAPAHKHLIAMARPTGEELHKLNLIGVRVTGDGVDDACEVPLPNMIDLTMSAEQEARRQLLDITELFTRWDAPTVLGAPFPGIGAQPETTDSGSPKDVGSPKTEGPECSGVPLRNPRFIGQEHHLEALRDYFAPLDGSSGGSGLRRATVGGLPGVGKSEIAREYTHRFARSYQRVWWIPATDRQVVRTRLVELAVALKLEPTRTGDDAEAALARLEREGANSRWLLIYDNAQHSAITGLLPAPGSGDVLITSTEDLDLIPSAPIPVEGINLADSCAILQDETVGLPALTDRDACELAKLVGRQPLALRLAAAWLREVSAKLQRTLAKQFAAKQAVEDFQKGLIERADGSRRISWPPISRLLALSLDELRKNDEGKFAVAVAQMCAFLSPDGVTVGFLRSPAVLAELAAAAGSDVDILARDEAELDRVLWIGTRFGLFEIDRGNPATLRMHRVIQASIRETMNPDELLRRHAQVLWSLAAYAPIDSDINSQHSIEFPELQRHLKPSGVADIDFTKMAKHLGPADQFNTHAWVVRRWVVAQIRYLYDTGDKETQEAAVDFAAEVEKHWATAFDINDHLRNRLAAQIANLYRALGHYRKALALDMATLARQRRDLSHAHPRTLMTARGLGGDLRELGRLEEALVEDETTFKLFCDSFGDDHPETLKVAFNLAISRFLMGYVDEALKLEESSYKLRKRVLGEDHISVWKSGRNLAMYLIELGRYDDAIKRLNKATDRIELNQQNSDHIEKLRIRRVHYVAERRKSNEHPDWLRKRSERILDRYRKLFGENNKYTLSCTLSHAINLHLEGDFNNAVELGEQCLNSYIRKFGPNHPLTNVCLANVAVFQRHAGETAKALANGLEALEQLRERLDDCHPWALAAAVNHARTLVISDQLDEALHLLVPTHQDCRDCLGDDHPSTKIATANLELTRHPAARSDPRWRDIDIELY